jgi:hypothetical protein
MVPFELKVRKPRLIEPQGFETFDTLSSTVVSKGARVSNWLNEKKVPFVLLN